MNLKHLKKKFNHREWINEKILAAYKKGFEEEKQKIYQELIAIADAGEYEDMRREVERYFKAVENINEKTYEK